MALYSVPAANDTSGEQVVLSDKLEYMMKYHILLGSEMQKEMIELWRHLSFQFEQGEGNRKN